MRPKDMLASMRLIEEVCLSLKPGFIPTMIFICMIEITDMTVSARIRLLNKVKKPTIPIP